MSETRYNGCTNRETWLYGLWFDGDYDAGLAQSAWDDAEANEFSTREQAARIALADMLKENFDEYLEQSIGGASNTGIIADLLSGAVSAINWFEIAEGLLDDVSKSEPSEDSEDELEAAHETQG